AAFRRALAVKPGFPTALFHLAHLRGAEPTDAEVGAIERALEAPRLPRQARIGLSFALARLCDERGEYDKAFLHCKRANDMKAADQAFDHEGLARHVDALVATFDRGFFAARRGLGSPSERPVFVVGMPRSGTTLVEQILASHPEVRGAGELAASNAMVEGLARLPNATAAGKAYPEAAGLLDQEEAQALAERYLEAVGRDAREGEGGEPRRVTDKMTGNFMRLGLIALLLPRARVIHCQRDPFDTCLSCYFQNFLEPFPFTSELSRLGKYYREYERLMAHWRAVLPAPMLEVPYEALVADPEPWCRRMLEFCGLPWDERVLRFFATERAVQTASFWQVRQPIYLSSVGRWRHYRAHLGSLFDALGREPDAHAAD
ncbi:MAG TPA: sulfotransferase, partial [Steroidobacteraceae bacterium]|nr:sulfotransferase [Steroidobacteraceae bacterium]